MPSPLDLSWARRGLALLWCPRMLGLVAPVSDVVSMRQFMSLSRNWPEELPSGSGSTLVVGGLEGCLDALTPEDAAAWLTGPFNERLLSFQSEYQGQAGLVLWLPAGRERLRTNRATESFLWHCAAPFKSQTLPLGQLLWAGAESDARRLMDPDVKNQDPDGPAWFGLHLVRVS